MSLAILVRKSDDAVVGAPIDPDTARYVPHPDDPMRRLASPVDAAWENDTWRLVPLEVLAVPEGKQVSGAVTRAYDPDAGKVVETANLEDVPPPPKRQVAKTVIQQRLDDAKLLGAAMTALMARPEAFARWLNQKFPAVDFDDPEALALLEAIGADPDVVMAP